VAFKTAARLVLEEAGHSLHYTDITELALESGHLKSCCYNAPPKTMRARLPVDGRYNLQSPFLQAAPGVKALKALRASS
jgi:hypothetical protein